MSSKKPRAVNNGYVDVYDVEIKPGIDFCDWIKLTKEKLKERESILLSIKITEIEDIVNKQLLTISTPCIYKINSSAINNTINTSIISVIDTWKGVNRTKKALTKFRDYFAIAKNWWDGRMKQKLTAIHFWINILDDIKQVKYNYIQTLLHHTLIPCLIYDETTTITWSF